MRRAAIASTGGELRNRPEWRAGLGAHWAPSAALKFSAAATYVGESFDSSIATGDVDLPAYTRVDVSAVWQISPRVETYLAIDNLTDEQYEQFVGFEARGIAPRLGVKFSFDEAASHLISRETRARRDDAARHCGRGIMRLVD